MLAALALVLSLSVPTAPVTAPEPPVAGGWRVMTQPIVNDHAKAENNRWE